MKFLIGVNLHIEQICKKVVSGIDTLKRMKPFIPVCTLQTIYRALIQAYFDYCSLLWGGGGWGGGGCNKKLKDNFQKFQNRAARIITDTNFDSRSADVLCSLAWDNLETRRSEQFYCAKY